jgi:outer membrane receptor protein involved in Fe transport
MASAHPLAMVVQSRTPEHGARRHHPHAEIDARQLTPFLAAAKKGGITHVGPVELKDTETVSGNRIDVPSYTVIDAGLRYETRFDGAPLIARLNVTNITNKHYWIVGNIGNSFMLGAPRTVSFSLTKKF